MERQGEVSGKAVERQWKGSGKVVERQWTAKAGAVKGLSNRCVRRTAEVHQDHPAAVCSAQ